MTATIKQTESDLDIAFISEFMSTLDAAVLDDGVVEYVLDLASAKYSTYFSDEKNEKLSSLDIINVIETYRSFLTKCQTSRLLIKRVSIYFSKTPSAPCVEDDFV